MTERHKQLQDIAIRWLYGVGCNVFAKEVPTRNGIADALGIKLGKEDVYYLECKASRSDLICKKQKLIYRNAVGEVEKRCYLHSWKGLDGKIREGWEDCHECKVLAMRSADTGIDFYYIVVADGLVVEDALYPTFGVINHKGDLVRRAKRMKRNGNERTKDALIAAAHVLVYKAYGKLYFGEQAA
jgi:hypothetical protein